MITTPTPFVFGTPLADARAAVILIHGRGSNPADMADLASSLDASGVAFVAPGAPGGSWYPQRFLAPLAYNEPALSRALATVEEIAADLVDRGLPASQIGVIGFSQGACLALEHALRAPRIYGFAAGLSGALIGPLDTPRASRDLARQPVLIGCAEHDAHIPLPYVQKSAAVLETMNADVTTEIYPGRDHTVFPSELDWINRQLERIAQSAR